MATKRWEETHFTPEDDVKTLVDTLPSHATVSLDIEIYSFTDFILVNSIQAAAARGVHIRINGDHSQLLDSYDRNALQHLINLSSPNISIRITESERGAIDHLKMIIVDGTNGPLSDSSSVLLGSYNFSDSAQKQDNVVIWTNDPGRVAQAQTKFNHDWEHNIQKPEWQLVPVSK